MYTITIHYPIYCEGKVTFSDLTKKQVWDIFMNHTQGNARAMSQHIDIQKGSRETSYVSVGPSGGRKTAVGTKIKDFKAMMDYIDSPNFGRVIKSDIDLF